MITKECSAVIIGASAGGINVCEQIIASLDENFAVPIIIVMHTGKDPRHVLARHFATLSRLNINEACEGDKLLPGNVYLAPGGYHLLIEQDETISFCVSEKVSFSRPSIDVAFKCASDVYQDKLLAIILTGANSDGTEGAKYIRDNNGMVIVQDPATATARAMPDSCIKAHAADMVLSIDEIISFLQSKVE